MPLTHERKIWAGDPRFAPWNQPPNGETFKPISPDFKSGAVMSELRAIREQLEALRPKPSIILTGQAVVDEYDRLTRYTP